MRRKAFPWEKGTVELVQHQIPNQEAETREKEILYIECLCFNYNAIQIANLFPIHIQMIRLYLLTGVIDLYALGISLNIYICEREKGVCSGGKESLIIKTQFEVPVPMVGGCGCM